MALCAGSYSSCFTGTVNGPSIPEETIQEAYDRLMRAVYEQKLVIEVTIPGITNPVYITTFIT